MWIRRLPTSPRFVTLRYSIRHLLLLAPAYALAVHLAPTDDEGAFVIYSFESLPSQIRILHSEVPPFTHGPISPRAERVLQQWLRGELSDSQLSEYRLHPNGPFLDCWGRPYQVAFNKRQSDGQVQWVGIYSLGYDGVSLSQGDDPDDLNSWDENSDSFYWESIATQHRQEKALNALYYMPFTYAGLLAVLAFLRRFCLRCLVPRARQLVGGIAS